MEALPFQFPHTLRSLSMDDGEPKDAMSKNLHIRMRALTVQKVPKRALLRWMGLSPMLCVFPIFAAPLPEMKEPEVICVQDIETSQWSEDSSTVDQLSGESMPVILPLDQKEIIQGLKEVLIGMKVGGKRRALIPPYVGYTNENLKPIPEEFGPRRSLLSHAQEPLVFEVQLLKVW